MGYEVFVPCIMVIRDCFALANDVSPQTPISFLSWTILQPHRVRRSTIDPSIEKYVRGDETIEGHGINRGVGIRHEHIFVECWIHTDDVLDLVINFELQWVHRRGEVDLETAISHEMGEFNQWYH